MKMPRLADTTGPRRLVRPPSGWDRGHRRRRLSEPPWSMLRRLTPSQLRREGRGFSRSR
ncbi:hypothetical protein [Paractinoplanes durhamensis]|uniref:hypothetical protein n=1 Tax=Paractinoplanes durhamensis TaxID=113563 RepID=UPI001940F5CC|nr:hypothetical protein [Actinoplanes durhamensis]